MKNSKGITLIALVITIIVMLILAAVSITMAVNGGLFGYAQNASTETQKERDLELEMGNLEDNLTYENMITKYAIVYGDLNFDGKVTALDKTLLSRYLLPEDNPRYLKLSERALLNADLNLDGIVDDKDAEILDRHLMPYTYELFIPSLPYTGE